MHVSARHPDLLLRLARTAEELLYLCARHSLVVRRAHHHEPPWRDAVDPFRRIEARSSDDDGCGRRRRDAHGREGDRAAHVHLEGRVRAARAMNRPDARETRIERTRDDHERRPQAHADRFDVLAVDPRQSQQVVEREHQRRRCVEKRRANLVDLTEEGRRIGPRISMERIRHRRDDDTMRVAELSCGLATGEVSAQNHGERKGAPGVLDRPANDQIHRETARRDQSSRRVDVAVLDRRG